MEMKKLDFAETLKDSIAIGVKNAPSVVVAVALWLVTIWIPYINIGTTIAISLLPVELAKGSVINPLGIFDSKYRRYMGEYLITAGLMAAYGLRFEHLDTKLIAGLGLAAAADYAASVSSGGPTNTELILTTTVSNRGRFVSRKTDVYYLENVDAPLFMRSAPAFKPVNLRVVS